MSDSSEPSYYEIALTNREVLVAFVAILCCVLAAFLGGVWLGRRGADRILAQEGVAVSEPAAAAEAEADVAQLEELRFFTEDKGEALAKPDLSALKDNNKSKQNNKTLAEDVGAKPELTPEERRERRQRRQERLEKSEDNDKSADDKAGNRKPNNKKNERNGTAKKPEVRPPSSPPPSSPPPTPPPSSPPPASAATGGFVVQVFSSHDQDQARKVLAQMQGAGHKAFLSPVEVDAATMYRVRLGPFDDRADADKAAEGVKSAFKLDTWVTAASN